MYAGGNSVQQYCIMIELHVSTFGREKSKMKFFIIHNVVPLCKFIGIEKKLVNFESNMVPDKYFHHYTLLGKRVSNKTNMVRCMKCNYNFSTEMMK